MYIYNILNTFFLSLCLFFSHILGDVFDKQNIKFWWKLKSESKVPQSCLTLCNPMDCSLPGSSVHETFQARVLQWVAISLSRESFWPRDQTRVSSIANRYFSVWATREAHNFDEGSFMFYSSLVNAVCIFFFPKKLLLTPRPGKYFLMSLSRTLWF